MRFKKKLRLAMFKKLLFISIGFTALEGSSDPSRLVVNKTTSLGDYKPHDLVQFKGIWVAKRIVKDLQRLLDAANEEGLTLKVVSGYRSYEMQINTFDRWTENELKKDPQLTREQAQTRANRYSARPGHSEHQLGTTVDILSAENGYKFSKDKKLKFVEWIEKNARKYNFKISYPEGHPEYDYEPWHVRWFPPRAIFRHKTP